MQDTCARKDGGVLTGGESYCIRILGIISTGVASIISIRILNATSVSAVHAGIRRGMGARASRICVMIVVAHCMAVWTIDKAISLEKTREVFEKQRPNEDLIILEDLIKGIVKVNLICS